MTYIVNLGTFILPLLPSLGITESSIEEPLMGDVTVFENLTPHNRITFQLVEEGSKHRKTKLVDSWGYSYNVRSKWSYATYWQCTILPWGNACKATAIQQDGTFQAGTKAHNHSSEPGAVTGAKIVKLVKEKALEDKFKLASAMVGEVFIVHLTDLQVNLANWRLRKNNV